MLGRSKPALHAAASERLNTINCCVSKRNSGDEPFTPASRPSVSVAANRVRGCRSRMSRSWYRHSETNSEKAARAREIATILTQFYPVLEVPLKHENTFQLLVAVILSAQCTDAAVNKI